MTVLNKNQQNKRAKRHSLRFVFTLSLSALFFLFSGVTTFTFYRLVQTNQVFKQMADTSIPRILEFEKISNIASELRHYTEKLSSARNPPSLRIARAQTNAKVQEISELFYKVNFDSITVAEFATISDELIELSNLVAKRLLIVDQLKESEQQIYDLLTRFANLDSEGFSDTFNRNWTKQYSDLFALVTKSLTLTQLNELRLLKSQISASVENLPASSSFPTLLAQSRINDMYKDFHLFVLSEKGLINQRMEQLRIEGRAVGRGHFTVNLVSDFARSVRFQASLISQDVLAESIEKNRAIDQQVNIISISLGISLLILFAITWFLKSRVINRLTELDSMVRGKIGMESTKIEIGGNDEISDIAETFQKFTQKIEAQQEELSKLVLLDGLTGIANRRAFDQEWAKQYSQAKRFDQSLSILIIDVDFFKNFNDLYGHQMGDDTLKVIAGIFKNRLKRDIDLVARYGGEEFAVILPNTDQAGAKTVANSLRESVENIAIKHESSEVSDVVTVSIGFATMTEESAKTITADELIKQADMALYCAKKLGRNRAEQA
ncbi:diguanylate cyclase [Aliiglaciecola sp. M165]|uniref:diguanylate cyclase n=1 Tax=Aliiglaciecola sp. M165 TaxID=2593649 RepID=UPI00117CD934|nr:diguanylate cyclase [Aliiglaciecola sp. M165]TRY31795.1 diguanylate cyclase [Aliiglaciecola sp. M165]